MVKIRHYNSIFPRFNEYGSMGCERVQIIIIGSQIFGQNFKFKGVNYAILSDVFSKEIIKL